MNAEQLWIWSRPLRQLQIKKQAGKISDSWWIKGKSLEPPWHEERDRTEKKMMRESRRAEAVHHGKPERRRISKGGLILSSYPVTNLAPDIWNLLRFHTKKAAREQRLLTYIHKFCQWIMKRCAHYWLALPLMNYNPMRSIIKVGPKG